MSSYTLEIETIDTHTMGEATRIVTSGFPTIPGNTLMEKKNYVWQNYDHLRKFLMNEPRGHKDMFGAILVPPCHPLADIGVIFMDSGNYLNMCGHGTIGTVTMCLNKGIVPKKDIIRVDTPSGLIECKITYDGELVKHISFVNVPAFVLYKNFKMILHDLTEIEVDISFGGSFFGIVNVEALNLQVDLKHKQKFIDYAKEIRAILNRSLEIIHPEKPDIHTVDLIEFSQKIGDYHYRNVVVFGDGQIDRSPCGTGTCAKLATLDIPVGQTIIQESIIGSQFYGTVLNKTKVGEFEGIEPQITGAAWITGEHTFVLQKQDIYQTGFSL